ncbi:hypothetical protein JQ616_17775 [Bradyrhizobium tropiciagri]|uniref:hypothetical protein n=1 Tax=Bradyrhizobium tropiciagri TaxID=312253 RepID=UPI001BA74902|nr:hypothetical protein [Bradyrhizobium tropiciagri]MBR0896813.1 hypothetical protein [Bradyrhizobium tropiciagri]
MTSDDKMSLMLARAAQRAARGPAPLIAPLVEVWRKVFEGDPAKTLDVADRTLFEIALCRRPRADRWKEDAAEIASEFGIEPKRFVSFLRAAEAAEKLNSAHPADDLQDGKLLAARDRDEED